MYGVFFLGGGGGAGGAKGRENRKRFVQAYAEMIFAHSVSDM